MSQKKRIYLVIATFHPYVGGAETQALLQARILRDLGHEATVVTFQHKKEWASREIVKGVPVIRVGRSVLVGRERLPRLLQRLMYFLALIMLGWTLWKHRSRYDLLHVYQLSTLTLPNALVALFARKPMLILVCSTGGDKRNGPVKLLAGPLPPETPCLHLDNQNWINGDLEGLVRLGRPFVLLAYQLLKTVNARVIITSSRMWNYLKENHFALPNTHLIPSGVDIQRFHPAEKELPEKSRTVVCVAQMRYEKGIDVLLQAWKLVQAQRPDTRLIVFGDGPLHRQLTELARALKVQESVEFAGARSDIPQQLHRGALSILPSRWEGMPNAVLEAMASGLPCIATRVSGSEDIIQDEINGRLIPVDDYHALAEAILDLLQDPEKLKRYGQAARKRIEQHYSLDLITHTYLKMYDEMISAKR
ncbi:glycosyltransferase involved in cell wall biosynthesis [Thermosporothrix hazakensis]|jgi:glycosyltransferase involved in cell wall biosynthesis|uniref:Glycosyltransferase involved in cell wall biosynthesis n=1 Tax=Thermosporothrix hazakensis TaxID=644383 RepID=A0A326UC07_THEHA|nr:glycosyltransferase family 4 protein [Thermosporothrix hazakensis]PZW36152.1 glycosyltransferase involved in cell wall biosynthesis [Thermosporothrix hazakensis]GCE46802.1 hypothetical protein KTH_16710 [Thermosporothrix hazakensis]